MKLVKKQLIKKFPVLLDVPCAAHIIQLCLKKIFEIENIENIISVVDNIVHYFRNNVENKKNLYQEQIKDDIKEPLTIIYPIEIGWSSEIKCIERILRLKKYIKIIATVELKLNKIFWKNLNSLYELLEPIELYTNKIQKDDASLYSVGNGFCNLIKHYESDKIPEIFKKNSEIIIETIKNKWNDHINNNLIDACKLFYLEDNYICSDDVIKFIINWGVIYLTTYKITDEQDVEIIKNILLFQINDFLAKNKNFSDICNKIKKIKDACNIKNIIYSPKSVWGGFLTSNYELTKVAIAILSIYPTEACVERSFSLQSDVYSSERNRLASEMIEAEMNIKMNFNKSNKN